MPFGKRRTALTRGREPPKVAFTALRNVSSEIHLFAREASEKPRRADWAAAKGEGTDSAEVPKGVRHVCGVRKCGGI